MRTIDFCSSIAMMATTATTATIATLALTARCDSRDKYGGHVQIFSKVSAFESDGFNGRDRHDGLNGHGSYNNYEGHDGHNGYNSPDSCKSHDGHNNHVGS